MSLRCEATTLPGVLRITPTVFPDQRGFFMETFHREKYRAVGIDREFVQDNCSQSCRGTVRGLHYQLDNPQAKLVSVLWGEVFDVAVDIRRGSPTFGHWVAQVLSAENRGQLFIPEGFAHGFCVLSEKAGVLYKCTSFYVPEDDRGLLWSDPGIGIPWPVGQTRLSKRDTHHRCLADMPADQLPIYAPPVTRLINAS